MPAGLALSNVGSVANARQPFRPTGGTVTTYSGYKVHTFLSNGTFAVPKKSKATDIDMLLIGGGGSGGRVVNGYSNCAGAGGAGEMAPLTGVRAVEGDHSVAVGAGGVKPPSSSTLGRSGAVSSALGYTANGGGGGGHQNTSGLTGGSSGGGGHRSGTVRTSVTLLAGGLGNTGGLAYPTSGSPDQSAWAGGGGGGAGAEGVNGASYNGGNGGAGAANNFRTGSNITYAGGGGGSVVHVNPGTGGAGGGGKGGNYWYGWAGEDGTPNTGSGGGGGQNTAGSGGSGICVIRYTEQ